MTAISAATGDLLCRAKWAYTTRRVPQALGMRLRADVGTALPGDLVLAEVEAISQHKRLHLRSSRPAHLYPGDLIVACAGTRYAPDQFEADAVIEAEGADLVAAGGLIGRVVHQHDRMSPPTRVRPLGLVTTAAGVPINIKGHALPARGAGARPPVVAVLGTSMNAGKTTGVASLVHGLTRAGLRVGAAKVTGTGALGDIHAYEDAGAAEVLDFTDAGHASTYKVPLPELEQVLATLIGHLTLRDADAIVLEVADGVYQTETAALMDSATFRGCTDAVLFAAGDALSAVGGAREVTRARLPLAGITGLVTRSPLASKEAAQVLDHPFFSREDLCTPAIARSLLETVRTGAARPVPVLADLAA